MASTIYVCDRSSCTRRGADACFVEIEELCGAPEGDGLSVRVHRTSCLGYCRRGPAVLVVSARGDARVHTRVSSLEASAAVVEDATGKMPAGMDGNGAVRSARLEMLVAARARAEARRTYRWNAALRGLDAEARARPALLQELSELMHCAGFPEGLPSVPPSPTMPARVEGYAIWELASVEPVSAHSAVFTFTTRDRGRGTPHPRGGGRLVNSVTWHTVMLAHVGSNAEGPLPWVEREYTPISTAKDWEEGHCAILIKVYEEGAATSWLHRTMPERVWLSKPLPTLKVPSLVEADGASSSGGGSTEFRPASVLLLLAGTGYVALPQILHHRDAIRNLGIPTPRWRQLPVPIDAVLSFREDDVLCADEIAGFCRDGASRGLRRATLLVTGRNAAAVSPFPSCAGRGDAAEAERALRIGNASVVRGRLSAAVVEEAVARMPRPCRCVVSGPESFNAAARGFLAGVMDADCVTVLAA